MEIVFCRFELRGKDNAMKKINGVKVILIDIDNTLLDFNKGSRASMIKCFEKFGLDFHEEMFPEFIRINDGLWRRIEKGNLTKDELHKIRWGLVFESLGIDFDGERFEKEFLETLKTSAVPVDGAFEILEYLSGKYMICAASNAPYAQQIARLTNVGMIKYFDKLFISEKVGCAKPSAGFFDACFSELRGITPKEAVMIGDSLTADIGGAADYGIPTVWFNYGGSDIPKGLTGTVVVNSLCELRDVL